MLSFFAGVAFLELYRVSFSIGPIFELELRHNQRIAFNLIMNHNLSKRFLMFTDDKPLMMVEK